MFKNNITRFFFINYLLINTKSMSHHQLREESNCLNCNYQVERRFCSNCGQENTENRPPYHYLFTHFLEDFTHYDGQFWDTFKVLFLKPGVLIETYLRGKRNFYVSPVKLYIFISFLTFFIPPIVSSLFHHKETFTINIQTDSGVEEQDFADILSNELSAIKESNEKETFVDKFFFEPFAEKYIELSHHGYNKEQIADKFANSFMHNLPRALFIYLPIFAFIMWLFHNKKKWFYYDHGIFTLYFFCFVLLVCMFSIIESYINDTILKTPIGGMWTFVFDIFDYFSIVLIFIYFFMALKRVYKENLIKVILKGTSILFISLSIFSLLLACLILITLKVTH